ncbi:MAG TPA: DUF2306 domain-containing protein [Chitinophagaceae bacterium]|nr:DUF2306 domain-containing protein [Chitinophagaceae bacterium]
MGTFLMLKGIIQYLALRDDVGFLRFKQDYLHIRAWKAAFYTHVFTSIFTLLAGFTQFSNDILRRHKKLHRAIGKIYVFAVLLVNFPAGMIMAVYANGGITSKIAFIILDSLWFWFTLKAFIEIRNRRIIAHKHFMMRSYALTLSAVALRSWQYILSHSFVIDPATLYKIDAWMGFVPNLLFAEWLIRKNPAKKKPTALAKPVKSKILPVKVQVDNN